MPNIAGRALHQVADAGCEPGYLLALGAYAGVNISSIADFEALGGAEKVVRRAPVPHHVHASPTKFITHVLLPATHIRRSQSRTFCRYDQFRGSELAGANSKAHGARKGNGSSLATTRSRNTSVSASITPDTNTLSGGSPSRTRGLSSAPRPFITRLG
jgi:hypothetical protein